MDKRFIFRYHHVWSDGRTREGRLGGPSGHGLCPVVATSSRGKSREEGKDGTKGAEGRLKPLSPDRQEKSLSVDAVVPVPQTDTGGWVE